jgi:zinc/manganese transport system substrate-binding protein
LLVGSRNPEIQKGARGHLDCSSLVDLLEAPAGKVDRSQGDVHPVGNPHYMLDPRAVERVAVGIGRQMTSLDPVHKKAYLDGTKRFLESLRAARAKWEKRLSRLRGSEVVAYHKSLSYLASWLGFSVIEHLEPRPGIPPNPRHIAHVIQVARQHGVRLVLQEAWFPSSTSRVVADKCAGRLVVLAGQPNFSAGESYVAFMENNVKLLERGLGG